MTHPLSEIFETEVTAVDGSLPRLGSRRVESSWVRTSVREARSDRLVATTLLNSAVLKASYPNYDAERASV